MEKSSKPLFVPDKNLVKDSRFDKKSYEVEKRSYNAYYNISKYMHIQVSKETLNGISDEAKLKYKLKSDSSTHNCYKRKPKNT